MVSTVPVKCPKQLTHLMFHMGNVRFYALVSSYLPVLLCLVKFEVNSLLYKINNYSHTIVHGILVVIFYLSWSC